MDAIKKNLDKIGNNNVNYIFLSLIIVFLIIFSFFTWIFNKLRLQDNEYHCKNYKSDNDGNGNNIKFITNNSKITDNNLNNYIGSATNSSRVDLFKNFHYLTAYNCCSGRNYKNDWVKSCALTKALDLGARCLDFEIFSINNEPVISSSLSDDVKNFTIKETYNYMAFNDAIQIIIGHPNSKKNSNNGPLILLFRMKSNNPTIYNKMGETLYENFYNKDDINDSRLLQYNYNYIFNSETSVLLYTTELIKLKNKIIIAVYTEYKDFRNTSLSLVTNIKLEKDSAPNAKAILYRHEELIAKGESNSQTIANSKSKLIFVLPPIDNTSKNMDANIGFSNGCQFIAMKLQFYDNNLVSYYNFFKSANSVKSGNQKTSLSPYVLKLTSKRKDKESPNNITPGIPLTGPDIEIGKIGI